MKPDDILGLEVIPIGVGRATFTCVEIRANLQSGKVHNWHLPVEFHYLIQFNQTCSFSLFF